ncbi:hypothetical protein NA78x_005681 [Anatilimnocola sp. NA78]|uniref:hypothetical protein n=1 Tax=Anatilimnocola sp. NA78 TaxID=3415683 RepID=UPI003CE4BF9D
MEKQLHVALPKDWIDASPENPNGPHTFMWDCEDASAALQIRVAEYSGGAKPYPSEVELLKISERFGHDHGFGKQQSSYSGPCKFGGYGTAIFVPQEAPTVDAPKHAQIWILSNGLDFIFVTLFAMDAPHHRELEGAQEIVNELLFN